MVTGASLLAILISVVGVFGLVIFETEYRRREIGIRKVYGATVTDILLMFNRKYLSIVVVCFVLATPVAYLFAAGWLENFAIVRLSTGGCSYWLSASFSCHFPDRIVPELADGE